LFAIPSVACWNSHQPQRILDPALPPCYAVSMTDTWVTVALFSGIFSRDNLDQRICFFSASILLRGCFCAFWSALPLLISTCGDAPPQRRLFWAGLRSNVNSEFGQVRGLSDMPRVRSTPFDFDLAVAVLVIGIRWKSSFGDTSELAPDGDLDFSSDPRRSAWSLHLGRVDPASACVTPNKNSVFELQPR